MNQALGAADRTTQVERARIEQLENQLRRLKAQVERLTLEREALEAQESSELLAELTAQESQSRGDSESLANALRVALERVQSARAGQLAAEEALESARGERERTRAECTSLEAVQKAALIGQRRPGDRVARRGRTLGPHSHRADFGGGAGLGARGRDRLGDYLEAVCIDRLDDLAAPLERLARGRVALVEGAEAGSTALSRDGALAAKVSGPAAVLAQLAGVLTAESLGEALKRRERWPRASRSSRAVANGWAATGCVSAAAWITISASSSASTVSRACAAPWGRGSARAPGGRRARAVRESLAQAEAERDAAQSGIQAAHRRHADITGQLEAARARAKETALRRQRIEAETAEHAREMAATQEGLGRAGETLEQGLAVGSDLNLRREELEGEREMRREALAGARAARRQRRSRRATSRSASSRAARPKPRCE